MEEYQKEITVRDGKSREYAEDGVTLLKIDGVAVSPSPQRGRGRRVRGGNPEPGTMTPEPDSENTGGIAAETSHADGVDNKKRRK